MFDHLAQPRKRSVGQLLTGAAIAVALHGALIAALVIGARQLTRGPLPSTELQSPIWEESGPVGAVGGAPAAETPLVPSIRLPDTLQLGTPNAVRVVLPPTRITADSVLLMAAAGGGVHEVRITPPRLATLVAEHAVVVPHSPPLQLSLPERSVEWSWTVRPTEPGLQDMVLRLDALAHVDGRDSLLTLGTVRREVFVRATHLQSVSRFFSRHWTWLSLLGLAAAVAWLRERRRRPPAPLPTPA